MKVCITALFLMAIPVHVYGAAAGTDVATVRQQLGATLTKLENAINRGVSGDELTQMMYTRDARVTGTGVEKGLHEENRGIAAQTVAIRRFLGTLAKPGSRHCHFELLDPIASSHRLAAAFVNMTCRLASNRLVGYHILYVWRKTSGDWKVSLEMFGSNTM